MRTMLWADGFGNWRAEFVSTGSDITDHEYAVSVIREELLRRGEIAADYIPTVGFIASYRGRVEFSEIDLSNHTTPVMVG